MCRSLALKCIDEVDASSLVETLDIGTIVDVDLAVDSPVARLALALIRVHAVETVGAVLARLRRALVDI